MVLKLFKFTLKTAPAFGKYLKKHGINGKKIKKIADYKTLPVMDKQNYLRAFEFKDLFPYRDLSRVTTISATSGTTGSPLYFPRGEEQDAQYEYVAELYLRNQFQIHQKKTLGLIGFGLGIWIGGMFTYKNFNKIAAKGYPFSLIPVGANVELYLQAFKKFAPLYDQIILMGYPPFVKDVIDEGKDHGIDWKSYKLRILTAAEGFSEKFREYLAEKAGIKNPYNDIINMYGTVEMGTMAHETGLANLIRKIAVNDHKIFRTIFPHANRTPTLAQYHPDIVYFEEEKGEVIATGYGSSIPLFRYRFPDIGGVVPFETMVTKLKTAGVDIFAEAKKAGIAETIMRLPFVYVYERSDHAIIVRGANIYPEEIKNALHHKELESVVTGKFTMIKKEDRKMNEYFEVNVELKRNAKEREDLNKTIRDAVVENLVKTNNEYKYLYSLDSERVAPSIILWPYQHEKYFKPGGKQKWSVKIN